MDGSWKRAILKNRARVLRLDYFDLTAPLLAVGIMPTSKHKEIKFEATTDKARVDLLLEWIEESAPSGTFEHFIQAVRNCDEHLLAKKIKREASASAVTIPKAKTIAPVNSAADSKEIPAAKSPKPKASKKNSILAVNGITPVSVVLDTPVTTPGALKDDKKPRPRQKKSATNQVEKTDLNASKVVAAPKPPAATPITTRKSSANDNDAKHATKAGSRKSATTKDASQPLEEKKPRTRKILKAKKMTFAQVESKQKDCRMKFKFQNYAAVVKAAHFKDKTDILYLGCPTVKNMDLCTKQVEHKARDFVCEDRHHNASFKLIPKLLVTCNDGTADLPLTFLKETVEAFVGQSSAQMESSSVNEIKELLDKKLGKKINIEVTCEKSKKPRSKKLVATSWQNIAELLSDEDPSPPAKRKRKAN